MNLVLLYLFCTSLETKPYETYMIVSRWVLCLINLGPRYPKSVLCFRSPRKVEKQARTINRILLPKLLCPKYLIPAYTRLRLNPVNKQPRKDRIQNIYEHIPRITGYIYSCCSPPKIECQRDRNHAQYSNDSQQPTQDTTARYQQPTGHGYLTKKRTRRCSHRDEFSFGNRWQT